MLKDKSPHFSVLTPYRRGQLSMMPWVNFFIAMKQEYEYLYRSNVPHGRGLMWLPGTNLNRKSEMGDFGKHISPLPSIK